MHNFFSVVLINDFLAFDGRVIEISQGRGRIFVTRKGFYGQFNRIYRFILNTFLDTIIFLIKRKVGLLDV